MKIIIVSDSHGNTSLLDLVRNNERDADLLIHCGDYCIPEYLMNGFAHVSGNCDWDMDALKQLDLKTPLGIIHVEHGNSFQIMCNSTRYIGSMDAFLVFSGHTHEKKITKIRNTTWINPGSLTRPRDSNYGSFLKLFIDDKTKEITYHFQKVDLDNYTYEEDFDFPNKTN